MKINQAFTIIQNASDPHVARIITKNINYLPWWRIKLIVRALKHGTPVAKIIHKKWFYGLCFYTNKNTLDPRPDTETLVDAVINDYKKINRPIKILDLGTGTGCIICSLIKNIPDTTGVAVDISYGAYRVAKRNIRTLELTNKIRVLHKSFCNSNILSEQFDVIVSNPPYIKYDDNRVDVGAKHDPKVALYADNNGYSAYITIAKNAKKWLAHDGKIYLEIGIGQADKIIKIFAAQSWKYVHGINDLSGILRVLIFKIN